MCCVYCLYVFFISGSKISTGLAYIFKLATVTFYLIYATIVIFICHMFFRLEVVLYCVFCFVLNSYACVFK
jgi:hypothetical protein